MVAEEDQGSGSERRRFQRVHTRIEVPYWKYVKVRHDRDVNIGFVKNISMGGFYIETDTVYQRGIEVAFEFYLPNSAKAVCGTAHVVWSRSNEDIGADSPQNSSMGLEFRKFEGESESILAEFIEQEIRKQQK